jgi:hypothetical protein
MTGPTVSRQIPHMTPAGQPTSESDPPPNPGPSSPNEPGGIFTANLKGVELANLAAEGLDEVIAAAERGIQRICHHTHHLAFSFLRYCGLSLW